MKSSAPSLALQLTALLAQLTAGVRHLVDMDKKYILQEIRHTAQENGGTPLGVQ